jgi:hydroxymethylbilane synthase
VTSERIIKIATRSSPLALWQAHAVKARLEQNGHRCEILPIESTGDIDLKKPIYELGVTGVFTKQLDIALLEKQADIAVHSLKDVPTQPAKGLLIVATLERGSYQDVLLIKNKSILDNKFSAATIATSSLRRKAQWLQHYPNHNMVLVRGNVQTRLRKFKEDSQMDGIIFAKAGLERMDLLPADHLVLDWMLPAAAQGIVGIACRVDDDYMQAICRQISHEKSFIEGFVERDFLRALEGGCSVPISGLARLIDNEIEFQGAIHNFEGTNFNRIDYVMLKSEWETGGREAADKILAQHGARELMHLIKSKKPGNEGPVDQST